MGDPKLETQKNFIDCIELGREMDAQEAISKLTEFHHVAEDIILDKFKGLNGFKGKVIFSKAISQSYPCIKIQGLDQNGNEQWSKYIDPYTGRPLSRSS